MEDDSIIQHDSTNPLLNLTNPVSPGVSPLEQEVLDEYSRLLQNMNQVRCSQISHCLLIPSVREGLFNGFFIIALLLLGKRDQTRVPSCFLCSFPLLYGWSYIYSFCSSLNIFLAFIDTRDVIIRTCHT